MAVQLTSSGGLSGQFQKYFNPKLLDHAQNQLVLRQFAMEAPLPREKGATQIRFTRQDVGLSSNVQTLTEGTPIATFRDTTLAFVDATLQLFGEAGRYSDLLTYTELFNILDIQHVQFAEDFALKADDLILNATIPNITGASKRYGTGLATQTFAGLQAAVGVATSLYSVQASLDDFTILSDQLAPKIGGEYVCSVPPRLARDLMNDTKWITAGQYGTTKGLFNGEIGRLYDVRYVVSTNTWSENTTENTRTVGSYTTTSVFTALAMGRSSFGVPALSGMSSKSPSIVIVNTPDSLNPLNQYTTMGWKAYYTAILLNNAFIVAHRALSAFV